MSIKSKADEDLAALIERRRIIDYELKKVHEMVEGIIEENKRLKEENKNREDFE
jgi:hypothetical protein